MNGHAKRVYDRAGVPPNGNEVSVNPGSDWRRVAKVH
jgi:hypothetical protein